MPISAAEFRESLRRWASGVTIVTARAGDRLHGMTVSSFAGVSLDPPLVLVCADKSSDTHAVIAAGGAFAVHVLTSEQRALSDRFAATGNEERRFEGVEWRPGLTGVPVLAGALVVLECRVVAAHDAGDHVVYVGRVETSVIREAEPLVYYQGRYRGLA